VYIPISVYFFMWNCMKDLVKRIVIGVISWVFMWYVIFLLSTWTLIVQSGYVPQQTMYAIILLVVFFFLFIFFAVYPVHFRMTKGTLFIIGLALIIFWDTILLNDTTTKVYLGDLVKLLWVVLTLLAWTNVLITDKVRKIKADKKVEIIEV